MEPDILLDLEIIYDWILLNFTAIFLSMFNIKKLVRNSSLILLQNLVLTVFIRAEKTYG
jgi:hypothetical protein